MSKLLFYNEKDEICLKHRDGSHEILYDNQYNYFELGGKWYNYTNGYFYDALEFDGDLDTYWDRRTHSRHMNIVEMEEAFAPPSYKSDVMDDLFKYKEDINSEQHLVMYMLASRVRDERMKRHESAYYSMNHYEFNEIGGVEWLEELGKLVLEGYHYDYMLYEDRTYEKAHISIYWSYE